MKKRLFEVVCNACWKIQNWRHQTHCASCGKQLTNLTHQPTTALSTREVATAWKETHEVLRPLHATSACDLCVRPLIVEPVVVDGRWDMHPDCADEFNRRKQQAPVPRTNPRPRQFGTTGE